MTGTSGSLSAFTLRAAALLAVATDVRMYVINNSEVNQTTTTYYLHAKLSPTTASLPTTAIADDTGSPAISSE